MKKILLFSAVLAFGIAAEAESKDLPPYKDASLPVETRIEDLLSRMTLDEKIAQLSQYSLGSNDNVNNNGEMAKVLPPEIGSLLYTADDAVSRNVMQRRAMEETRLGIPIIFGYDTLDFIQVQ